MSVGVSGLELSRSDFVPESDSEDDDDHKADDAESKALVEETQAYDDDDDDGVGNGGIFGNGTLTADVTPQQVILHCLTFITYNINALFNNIKGSVVTLWLGVRLGFALETIRDQR